MGLKFEINPANQSHATKDDQDAAWAGHGGKAG